MAAIPKIFLPASCAGSGDDHAPVDWLGRFCGKLVEDGPYDWSDLPPAARAFAALDSYAGEVSNGGHFQYLQNLRWDEGEVQACKLGLDLAGSAPHRAIFDDLVGFMARDGRGDRFREKDINGWSAAELEDAEAALRDLDARFFELSGLNALIGPASKALLARPEVELVPDMSAAIGRLLEARGSSRARVHEVASAIIGFGRLASFTWAVCEKLGRKQQGKCRIIPDERLRLGVHHVLVPTDQGPLNFYFEGERAIIFDERPSPSLGSIQEPSLATFPFALIQQYYDEILRRG